MPNCLAFKWKKCWGDRFCYYRSDNKWVPLRKQEQFKKDPQVVIDKVKNGFEIKGCAKSPQAGISTITQALLVHLTLSLLSWWGSYFFRKICQNKNFYNLNLFQNFYSYHMWFIQCRRFKREREKNIVNNHQKMECNEENLFQIFIKKRG